MTILLIILLILLVVYLYYQNQQLKANSSSQFPGSQSEVIFSAEELEIKSLKEAVAQLQSQINELKKNHD